MTSVLFRLWLVATVLWVLFWGALATSWFTAPPVPVDLWAAYSFAPPVFVFMLGAALVWAFNK